MSLLHASTPLNLLNWLPVQRRAPLARLGIHTLGQLIEHFPRRYEDRKRFPSLPNPENTEPVCLHGRVESCKTIRLRNRGICFEAILIAPHGGPWADRWTCRWFNAHYITKLVGEGDSLVVFGKVKYRKNKPLMDHPEFEVLEDEDKDSPHFGRITPVHPSSEGITPRILRWLIHRALREVEPSSLTSPAPDGLSGPARLEALKTLHFPESWEALEAAKHLLINEEFFLLQARLCWRRAREISKPSAAKPQGSQLVQNLLASLPFQLTPGQQQVWEEISADLAEPRPMRRLLQGDVGSGKTVIAALAAAQVIAAGWQAALMAPTQILAEQHYRTLSTWLAPLGISIALSTSDRKTLSGWEGAPFTLSSNDTPTSQAQLIVGTHSLLYESTPLPRLGLVIIDEQHKFGALQRERLAARADAPDVLVMSATPIPRTLTATLHGDLDVSLLKGRPAQRGKVITAVRQRDKLPAITGFLRSELAAGRQAYIVYPLIEQTSKTAARAAAAEHKTWQQRLAPHAVALLHGRLSPEEKDAVMQSFASGQAAALVSTTVIEVGVDVPNATIMLIENAERFGLAQLHQLRGRIGRGQHKSYCILLCSENASHNDPSALTRLRILEKTSDGFEIAEADWALRGPGDLAGTAQSGLPQLKIGDLRRDSALMLQARKKALALFSTDPTLTRPEHTALAQWLANVESSERTIA